MWGIIVSHSRSKISSCLLSRPSIYNWDHLQSKPDTPMSFFWNRVCSCKRGIGQIMLWLWAPFTLNLLAPPLSRNRNSISKSKLEWFWFSLDKKDCFFMWDFESCLIRILCDCSACASFFSTQSSGQFTHAPFTLKLTWEKRVLFLILVISEN